MCGKQQTRLVHRQAELRPYSGFFSRAKDRQVDAVRNDAACDNGWSKQRRGGFVQQPLAWRGDIQPALAKNRLLPPPIRAWRHGEMAG